jgi:Tfp pilus assembly protein PilN
VNGRDRSDVEERETMKSVNLIPAPRRDAKRRRRQRNLCAVACGAYALALAGAIGGAQMVWHAKADNLDERLTATDNDIRRLERQAADERAELARARATIEANRMVAEQPDWSVLLALLAKTTGDDVVLRTISIGPPLTGSVPTPAAGSGQPEFSLDITGVGRTPLAVSRHVLRLEQTGLFSKVALIDTGREAFLNENSIAFRLQCTFGEGRPQPYLPLQPSPLTSVEPGGINR